MSTVGPPNRAPRGGPRIPTKALTITNVIVLIISGFAFARAEPHSLPALIEPLVITFPTVAALFEAPPIWLAVLLVAVVIAALSTRRSQARPWWPRFYRKLAWCGIATIPLGWVFTGILLAAIKIYGIT